MTGNSDELLDRCHASHNVGRATGTFKGTKPYFTRGSNYRMQQFQAVILMQHLKSWLDALRLGFATAALRFSATLQWRTTPVKTGA